MKDGLRILTAADGRLRSPYWYARLTRRGRKADVSLPVKVEGVPPVDEYGKVDLASRGDADFEKSRAAALAELDKLRRSTSAKGKTREVQRAEEESDAKRFYLARTGTSIKSPRLESLGELWRNLTRDYTPTAERTRITEKTFDRFRMFARDWCREHGGECTTIDEITRDVATAWFEAIKAEYAWATVVSMMSLMRNAWKRWHKFPGGNPFGDIITRSNSADSRPVTRDPLADEALQRLFDVTRENPGLHGLVVAAACTGMRLGDCCMLRWADVDLGKDLIEVQTAKTGVKVTLPIFEKLREVLLPLREKWSVGDSPYVFPWAAERYAHVNDKGIHDRRGGLVRMVKPYFALAVFPSPTPAPAILADESSVSLRDALERIDAAGFAPAKAEKMRECVTRRMCGEKYQDIAAAIDLGKGQISDYLREAEEVTGAQLRGTARGDGMTKRDLIARTRARRSRGKHSASLWGWHNLRHSFIIRAFESGVPVNDIARIVGHADVKVTLDNYGNNSPKVVAERAKRRMDGAAPTRPGLVIEAGTPPALPCPVPPASPALPPPPAATSPRQSVRDRLRELKDLADEGLITSEEFAAKRAAIVAEL